MGLIVPNRQKPPEPINARPKKGFMGLFGRKKKCPSCGQKLHPSWDQCPFCSGTAGAQTPIAAPMPSQGGKQRTVAISAAVAAGGPSVNIGWLVPLEGPHAGELYQLNGRSVVGTATDCDVVLSDPSISSRHAELFPSGVGFRIQDLGIDQRHLRQRPAGADPRSGRQRHREARPHGVQVQVDELTMRAPLSIAFAFLFGLIGLYATPAQAADSLRLERLDVSHWPTVSMYLVLHRSGRTSGDWPRQGGLQADSRLRRAGFGGGAQDLRETGEPINVVVVAQLSRAHDRGARRPQEGDSRAGRGCDAAPSPSMALLGYSSETKRHLRAHHRPPRPRPANKMVIDTEAPEVHMLDALRTAHRFAQRRAQGRAQADRALLRRHRRQHGRAPSRS